MIEKSKTCFLITPISEIKSNKTTMKSDDWNFLRDQVIKPVLSKFGYEVVRADSINKSGSIIKDIVEHICTAELAIVDLTGLNPNVLYELGVRHSISNKTILLTQNLKELPFDLQDLRTIEYNLITKGPKLLKEKLEKTVKSIDEVQQHFIDNPVLEYLSKNKLVSKISQAVTYYNYLTPPQELYNHEEKRIKELNEKLNSELILVKAGKVIIGLRDYEISEIANLFNVSGKAKNQRNRHFIELEKDVLFYKYPITNSQYKDFIQTTKYQAPDHWRNGWYFPLTTRDHPLSGITYYDALKYCEWRTNVTNVLHRLPTELEWEMAARNSRDINYPWGDRISLENCNSELSRINSTVSVFTYEQFKSYSGLLDMCGNVWEWCEPTQLDFDEITIDDTYAVLKGGGWESTIFEIKIGYREVFKKQFTHNTIGFRCVCEADK